jgi:hypothetical protein
MGQEQSAFAGWHFYLASYVSVKFFSPFLLFLGICCVLLQLSTFISWVFTCSLISLFFLFFASAKTSVWYIFSRKEQDSKIRQQETGRDVTDIGEKWYIFKDLMSLQKENKNVFMRYRKSEWRFCYFYVSLNLSISSWACGWCGFCFTLKPYDKHNLQALSVSVLNGPTTTSRIL